MEDEECESRSYYEGPAHEHRDATAESLGVVGRDQLEAQYAAWNITNIAGLRYRAGK